MRVLRDRDRERERVGGGWAFILYQFLCLEDTEIEKEREREIAFLRCAMTVCETTLSFFNTRWQDGVYD